MTITKVRIIENGKVKRTITKVENEDMYIDKNEETGEITLGVNVNRVPIKSKQEVPYVGEGQYIDTGIKFDKESLGCYDN